MVNPKVVNTYLEIVRKAVVYMDDHGQRPGQSYFNAIQEILPSLANQIRATDLDPYYHDERLGSCLAFILNNMEKVY